MIFGLPNASILLHEMIDATSTDMQVCIWCLHIILIYSSNMEGEHIAMVQMVLQQSIEHGPTVNLYKSKFHIYVTICTEVCHQQSGSANRHIRP